MPPGEDLVEALARLSCTGRRLPASDELRAGWADLGRAWIIGWAEEFRRDLGTISTEISTAVEAADADAAQNPLENALWRLDSAREKLHAVIALAFGVRAPRLGADKKQTIRFDPDEEAIRAKLRELAAGFPAAQAVLDQDATAKGCLLLRHQVAHSLAPIVKAPSLTWFEVAFIQKGGVTHYEAKHLPAAGLDEMSDIGTEALMARSVRIAEQGLSALTRAASALAELLDEAGELEPPPILWYATEVGRSYLDRAEAEKASRGRRT
jgi:hypothetical protein